MRPAIAAAPCRGRESDPGAASPARRCARSGSATGPARGPAPPRRRRVCGRTDRTCRSNFALLHIAEPPLQVPSAARKLRIGDRAHVERGEVAVDFAQLQPVARRLRGCSTAIVSSVRMCACTSIIRRSAIDEPCSLLRERIYPVAHVSGFKVLRKAADRRRISSMMAELSRSASP